MNRFDGIIDLRFPETAIFSDYELAKQTLTSANNIFLDGRQGQGKYIGRSKNGSTPTSSYYQDHIEDAITDYLETGAKKTSKVD